MSEVNIGGSEKDLFYRYKRDKILLIYEKNCTQSRLLNIHRIAKQLELPFLTKGKLLEALLKRIKKTIGVALIVECTIKKPSVLIKAKVEPEKIEEIINLFIDKHVLCEKCRLPEWNGIRCNACGYS
jgi:translation initiation factor 2 beta subunit (eIF-2beta)/eIF-5